MTIVIVIVRNEGWGQGPPSPSTLIEDYVVDLRYIKQDRPCSYAGHEGGRVKPTHLQRTTSPPNQHRFYNSTQPAVAATEQVPAISASNQNTSNNKHRSSCSVATGHYLLHFLQHILKVLAGLVQVL